VVTLDDDVTEDIVLRVMVLMTLADGDIGEDEVIRMRWIHGRVVGRPVSEAEVRAVIGSVREEGLDIDTYLASICDDLGLAAKRRLLRAAFAIATADGRILAAEDTMMIHIAKALAIPPHEYRAALSQLRLARELGG
jgi:uncharacterized tellurite resistance protein B-like protein